MAIADHIFMLDVGPVALAGLFITITELLPSLRTYLRSKPGQEVPATAAQKPMPPAKFQEVLLLVVFSTLMIASSLL